MGTIARSTWVDDDGSGTTGSIVNNAELQKVYDNIDAEVKSATNSSTQTKQVIDMVLGTSPSVKLKGFQETKNALSLVANVLTVDYSAGNVVSFTLNSSASTTTFQNVPSGVFAPVTWVVTASSSNGVSTWPWLTGTVHWPGGNAPTLSTTTGKIDILNTFTMDGGSSSAGNWYGVVVGLNY